MSDNCMGSVSNLNAPLPRPLTVCALPPAIQARPPLAGFPLDPQAQLIATLHDPVVVRKLLAHLGMARSGPSGGSGPPESDAAAS
jgi:hypothetical protein